MRSDELVERLRERGLLLLADNVLPSVATIVAGEPIRGSWWAHPKSHAIFGATTALARHPDVVAIPFISGKVTFVHRRLWPALLAVGLAREPWQTAGLSREARALLRRVEKAGELQAAGDAVRELERRLLAKTAQVHTEAGSHAKHVERWDRWAERAGVTSLSDVGAARRELEEALALLAPGTRATLPWSTQPRQSKRR